MLRAVADTNVVVSGFLYRGIERALLDAAHARRLILLTSAVLLAELADVLPRAKFARRVAASNLSVPRIVRRYARLSASIARPRLRRRFRVIPTMTMSSPAPLPRAPI